MAEGPGHQRDTQLLLRATGLEQHLEEQRIPFLDLSRDEVAKVRLRADYSRLGHLWLPRTVLEADFVVSMSKVKTHHWSGVTLSMKNMFGVVPGVKYGWPKNLLHLGGVQQSIVDLVATVPIHIVIGDAIVCMEGNAQLAETPRRLDRIVLSDDSVAADATCARLMGLFTGARSTYCRDSEVPREYAFWQHRSTGCAVSAPSPFRTVQDFERFRAKDTPVSVGLR